MEGIKIIKYSDIFLSCFTDNAQKRTRMAKEHYLGYIYSGEMALRLLFMWKVM
jgi:hypothetical protein